MSLEGHFNYRSISEPDDQLDYSYTKPCPNCKKPIAVDATICYFCGQDVVDRGKAFWIGWVVGSLIVTFILSMLFYAIG